MYKLIADTKYGKIYLFEYNGKKIIKKINFDIQNFQAIKTFDSFYNHEYLCKIFKMCLKSKSIYMEYVEGEKLENIFLFENRIKLAKKFYKYWIRDLYKVNDKEKFRDIDYLDKLNSIRLFIDSKQLKIWHLEKLYKYFEYILFSIKLDNKFLLHGDIHNKNLILQNNGKLKLIDLSPIKATREFEYVKFFENELYSIKSKKEFIYKYIYMTKEFELNKSFAYVLYLDSCFRMFDTLFVEKEILELEKMRILNTWILEEIVYEMEL